MFRGAGFGTRLVSRAAQAIPSIQPPRFSSWIPPPSVDWNVTGQPVVVFAAPWLSVTVVEVKLETMVFPWMQGPDTR